jgi:glucuronoarabinoxylan endo-1,4-beta-xylanase
MPEPVLRSLALNLSPSASQAFAESRLERRINTYMYKIRIIYSFFLVFLAVPSVFAQSVTVTWTDTHQTMDGFGAGETFTYANSLTSAQLDSFFSPTAGVGFTWIRTGNSEDGSIPDLVTLQGAVARGAKILMTLQSPPVAIKSTGTWNHGALGPDGNTCFSSNPSLASNMKTWADNIVGILSAYNSNGVPITALSVDNEPNIEENSYGACEFTAAGIDSFVGTYLGPALAASSFHPRLLLAETSGWMSPDDATPCLNDANCAQYVDTINSHNYSESAGNGVDGTGNGYCCKTATAYPLAATKGKRLWLSETNGGLILSNGSNCAGGTWCYDPSMADALVWAHQIHDYLTIANVSYWQYWEMLFNNNLGYWSESGQVAQRFYAVGNWSKFVRSGWVRIDATTNPQAGVYVTAFKDPSADGFAIVAINTTANPVNVDFTLSGFPSVTSVTPTLTSASANLADQANANVSGGAFSYSLPATSVVTFHSADSSSSSKPPASPTGLVVTVH